MIGLLENRFFGDKIIPIQIRHVAGFCHLGATRENEKKRKIVTKRRRTATDATNGNGNGNRKRKTTFVTSAVRAFSSFNRFSFSCFEFFFFPPPLT